MNSPVQTAVRVHHFGSRPVVVGVVTPPILTPAADRLSGRPNWLPSPPARYVWGHERGPSHTADGAPSPRRTPPRAGRRRPREPRAHSATETPTRLARDTR